MAPVDSELSLGVAGDREDVGGRLVEDGAAPVPLAVFVGYASGFGG